MLGRETRYYLREATMRCPRPHWHTVRFGWSAQASWSGVSTTSRMMSIRGSNTVWSGVSALVANRSARSGKSSCE